MTRQVRQRPKEQNDHSPVNGEQGRPRRCGFPKKRWTRMRMAKTTADTTPSKRAKVLRLPAPRTSGQLVAQVRGTNRRKYARLYRRYLDAVQAMWTASGKRLAALQQGWRA